MLHPKHAVDIAASVILTILVSFNQQFKAVEVKRVGSLFQEHMAEAITDIIPAASNHVNLSSAKGNSRIVRGKCPPAAWWDGKESLTGWLDPDFERGQSSETSDLIAPTSSTSRSTLLCKNSYEVHTLR